MNGGFDLHCPADLVPAPGQYVQAIAEGSTAILADTIFSMGGSKNGFLAAPPLPAGWMPGTRFRLRGPFGHGFSPPASARRVALIAFDDPPFRLTGLIDPALEKSAEVVIVAEAGVIDLPEVVEIQPVKGWMDVWNWADAIASEISRENWPTLREKFVGKNDLSHSAPAQVLLRTSMPCAGAGDCGVCAITVGNDWKMACKDGPVFDLLDLISEY